MQFSKNAIVFMILKRIRNAPVSLDAGAIPGW
jgi:hypothetical protein